MEDKEYILGTEKAELHRLGIQHQVWSGEAREAWKKGEFSAGQNILDLGCGPGFCSIELAYMVGEYGKIIAIDQSQGYIDFLNAQATLHGLNIKTICTNYDDMKLMDFSLDGVYSRWALAWITNQEEIIAKIYKAMAPGGVFVAHEYYDWATFQTEPSLPALQKAINVAFNSFNKTGNINIGRKLPELFTDAGLEVISIRPMSKIAIPDELTWEWPKTFLEIYLPKLVSTSFTKKEVQEALMDLADLEDMEGASILCPTMVEVVAVKP